MDATYLQQFLSDSARSAKRSDIRELLKLIARPNVISMAGGLPSPETFPIEQLSELVPHLLHEHGASALQYGATEGDAGLREELVKLMAAEGVRDLTIDHILVTSASQQGLDLLSRVFLAPGDAVMVSLPSYLGALGAFTACGARLSGIPIDERGMPPDLLEQRLIELRHEGVRPKLLYLVPDFQNPAGITLSLECREQLLDIARDFDLLVVEDTPYRQLRYTGETLPYLYQLDRDGRVISLFTFSKIMCPGFRLGWVVADPEIISRLVVAKQPVDLCTSPFNQALVREYLRTGHLSRQIERIRALYSRKREAILQALERYMDPSWGVTWTRPEGGLFLWVRLPEWMSARKLLDRTLALDVAFVVGTSFHCDGSGQNTMRLNFSFPSIEQLDTAIRRMARCIGETLAEEVPGELTASTEPQELQPPALVEGAHSLEQLSWNLAVAELVE
jgi:2-aminoadipate transaminase